MGMNYAAKYSNKVDERFYRESQALIGTNKDYEWSGVKTVKVYQVDTVPLNDYQRSGSNRYGSPTDLGNTIQEMTITQDKSFTYIIDRGDKDDTMMVMDAGKSLAREQREVMVPFVDTYIFGKQAGAAFANNQFNQSVPSSSTAYSLFLKAGETLGNKNVPDAGRIAFCSYGYANLLMLDPAFIKYSDRSQEMVIKGILGEVDGVKIIKVPASRLPFDTSFLMVHQMATVAPRKLEEYKTHDNPPGISGWLVEGRLIFDAFVLNGKVDCLYVQLGAGANGTAPGSLTVSCADSETAGATVVSYGGLNLLPGYTAWMKAASGTAPDAGNYGSTLDTTGWTQMADASGAAVTSKDLTTTNGYKVTVAILYNGKVVAAGEGTAVVA